MKELRKHAVVYVLTEYEPSSYSYSGIEPSTIHLHLSKEGAEKHAAYLGLTIVNYCTHPGVQATIHQELLLG